MAVGGIAVGQHHATKPRAGVSCARVFAFTQPWKRAGPGTLDLLCFRASPDAGECDRRIVPIARSIARHRLRRVIRHALLRGVWPRSLFALFQAVCLESEDLLGPAVLAIDEVHPARLIAHDPDIVPDAVARVSAVGHQGWGRTLVDWFTCRLGEHRRLIQRRRPGQLPFRRRLCRAFDAVLLYRSGRRSGEGYHG